MAFADYRYCDRKGCNNKAFYDAHFSNYLDPSQNEMLGYVKCLCAECADKYRLVVLPKIEGENI